MPRIAGRIGIMCCGLATLAASAPQGDVSVTSASITAEQRAIPSHVGWVENRHTVALFGWSVASAGGRHSGSGVVPPGGRTWLHLAEATGPLIRFRLAAVTFADGTYDGDLDALLGPTDKLVQRDGLLEAVDLSTSLGVTYDLVATIENRREHELVAWRYDWSDANGMSRRGVATDACASLSEEPGRGRVRPGERRETTLANGLAEPASVVPRVRLSGAAWADGHFEGDAAWGAEVAADRQNMADEADFWVPLLRQAATMPGSEGLAFLRGKRDHRLWLDPHRRSTTAANLERWARQLSAGSTIQLPVLFTGAATLLEQQRRQCGV